MALHALGYRSYDPAWDKDAKRLGIDPNGIEDALKESREVNEEIDWTKVKKHAIRAGISLPAAIAILYGTCNPEKLQRTHNMNFHATPSYQKR